MSLEMFAANKLLDNQSGSALLEAVQKLDRSISISNELVPKPLVILRSNANNLSSNVADGVLILESAPTPANTYITIADWNINFTNAAGTVRAVILDASGAVINNVLLDVNSSTNGTGGTVLGPGDRLAILGQTAGAGVFGCYFSGTRQLVRNS